MDRLFHPDSPFMALLRKTGTLILLNLLWLLFCMPVLTFGPATTALYSYMRKIDAEDWPPIWSTFWRGFRDNFRQAFMVSLCLCIPAAAAGLYLLQALKGDFIFGNYTRFFLLVAVWILTCFCSYAFPLIASFENTVGGTMKNALLLPLVNPIVSVAVSVLNLLPLLILVFDVGLLLRLGIFWMLIGTALTAYINDKLLRRVFRTFI